MKDPPVGQPWQAPATQIDFVPLHVLPQVPQLFGSVCRLLQYGAPASAPQSDCPAPVHAEVHAPYTQCRAPVQVMPQPPQFLSSICVFAQYEFTFAEASLLASLLASPAASAPPS